MRAVPDFFAQTQLKDMRYINDYQLKKKDSVPWTLLMWQKL
jgi:hypothetical protein